MTLTNPERNTWRSSARVATWLITVLFTAAVPSVADVEAGAQKLHGAWSELLEDRKAAEGTLLEEQHFPPVASDRVLADGYRYMLAHLNREIELAIRADPQFPEFFRSMDMLRKWTGENPDTMYLKADKEGHYKLLIGPERPKAYRGNFLYSRAELECKSSGVRAVTNATSLSVREIFSDWANEVPLDMTMSRLDSAGSNRPPLDVEQMAEILATLGDKVGNQIRFWNLLMEFPLEMNRDRNGDGKRALPVNAINQPAPPFTAGGVAGASQLYAAGIFDLNADEALVIKMTAPVEPYYVGFQLNNLWMEGPDQ